MFESQGSDVTDLGKNVLERNVASGAIPTLKHRVEKEKLIKETEKELPGRWSEV